jgi:ribosomal protein L7/L12
MISSWEMSAVVEDLRRRVEELESRVAELDGGAAAAERAATVSPVDTELLDLVRQGRTIDAINVYRERTGVGLAEAKAAIDRLRGPA